MKIIVFILLGILLFAAGTFYPNSLGKKIEPIPTKTVEITPIITEAINPTLNPSPTVQEESDLLQLQKAFAKKYNHQVSEAEVTISKKDDTHISGGIKFTGEIAGGWFLAYKGTDGWMIVQDGNGTISCEIVAPYNFPKTMVPECVDKNGNLVK
jgi:hypothetical protein